MDWTIDGFLFAVGAAVFVWVLLLFIAAVSRPAGQPRPSTQSRGKQA